MQVKDLKPNDKIWLEGKNPLERTVAKLVPSNLPSYVFVYFRGEGTPELLRKSLPLVRSKSGVWIED